MVLRVVASNLAVVYAVDDLEDALNTARMLAHYCKEYGVVLHIAYEGLLLSTPRFLN